jgi:ABC-2 type transport system permease protein
MNWRIVRAVALKDLTEVRGNPMAWGPSLALPIIFTVVLPTVLILVATYANMSLDDMTRELGQMGLFNVLKADLSGMDVREVWVVLMVGHLFAPMFLILPLMLATTIGADSFVGERERKTLEPLIYAPATDSELFTGKVLASFVPAVLVTWLSFLLYVIVANGVGWPLMGRLWFPLPSWYPLVFWITPALALLGTAAVVLVSSRAKTFMEAYQSSGALVLVPIAFFAGQATGILYLGILAAIIAGAVLWVVDYFLIVRAIKSFRREALISRV